MEGLQFEMNQSNLKHLDKKKSFTLWSFTLLIHLSKVKTKNQIQTINWIKDWRHHLLDQGITQQSLVWRSCISSWQVAHHFFIIRYVILSGHKITNLQITNLVAGPPSHFCRYIFVSMTIDMLMYQKWCNMFFFIWA